MSDLNQNATVNLQLNGEQAKSTLIQLRQRAFDLRNALAKNANDLNKVELKKLQQELRKTDAEVRRIESSSQMVNDVMRRLDKASPKELRKTLRTLHAELNKIERGSDAWNAHAKKIHLVEAELSKMNATLHVGKSRWERFNMALNNMQTTIMAAVASIVGLVQAARSAVNAYAEMDAEMANVRKYTGMTAQQVEGLNEELKKMDTRTSREELNKLAQEAGRLGKTSQEDILGFVRASDQINVALDELGDGATLTLSKLTNIFGAEKRLGTERSLLAVGSVINDLSQNSTASAGYLAEFAKRLAGVGNQAHMTIQEIMAFGAVLDSQGQAVEMSATALSKLIMELFKKTDVIAKATGMDLQKFKEALNSSTNDGLLMLLDRLHELGGMDVLAPVFKDMGENGARASAVISALAGNVDVLRQQQEAANKAFRAASSVTKEYNVQNNTVAAGLDKRKKKVRELAVELGEQLLPIMQYTISSTTILMRLLNSIIDFLKKHKESIIALTAGITTYYATLKIATLWENRHRIAMFANHTLVKSQIIAMRAFKVMIAACTFNVKALTVSWNKLNTSMKRNVFGLILAVIATVVAYIWQYVEGLSEVDEYTRKIQDSLRKTKGLTSEYAKEKEALDKLFDALKNATKGSAEYKAIKNQIISQYGTYLKGLINEKGEIINLEDAYNRLNIAVAKNAKLKGIEEAKEEVQSTYYTDIQKDLTDFESSLQKLGIDNPKQKKYMQYMSELITNGTQVPQNILEEIKNLSTWALAEDIFGQNDDKPLTIYNRIAKKTNEYIGANRQLAEQEGILRPYMNADEHVINWAIESINKLIESGESSGNIMKLIKDDEGNIITNFIPSSIEDAKSLLSEYQWELSQRGIETRKLLAANSELIPTVEDTTTPTSERFGTQKNERIKKETLNKISYAKGDITAFQYERANLAIEKEYYDNISKITDLSEKEILEIRLGYAENEKKQKELSIKDSIELENEAYADRLAYAQQAYAEGRISLSAYNEERTRLESQHLAAMVVLHKDNASEIKKAIVAQKEFEIKEALAKKKKLEAIEKDIKKQFFGENASENKANYDLAMSALDSVYQAELKATEGNEAEKLRITEAYEQAKLVLKKKYNQESIEDNRNSLEKANAELLEWMQSDGSKSMLGAFDTIMSGLGSIFSQVSGLVQAELEIQTNAIEKRYDKEIQLAEGNKYRVAQLERAKEKEIAKAKNEANRKMFAMQVIQAVAQTAQNALNAYGSAAAIPLVGYILAPIAASMAVAAGALQVAVIKKQQKASQGQGYAEGGFTRKGRKYEPAGIVHAGEWVASQDLLASPVARPIIDSLDYAQRNNRIASLRSEDVSASITAPSVIAGNTNGNIASAMTAQAVALSSYADSMNRLNQRLNEPFVTVNTVTGDMGIRKAQDDYQKLIRNKQPKQ